MSSFKPNSATPFAETFEYPTNQIIQYSNDTEFRKSLRELFGMKFQPVILNDKSLDAISMDESNYDEETTKKWLNWISSQTAECYELNELYKLAAATMISLDRETGLAVLFSFDYFADFHNLLVVFFKNPGMDLEMFPAYDRLWNRLSKK